MSHKFSIVGAGLAGLLAAAMLRDEATEVIEAQDSLPHNHEALLRFRSSIVGDTLNVPFKKVSVMKAVAPYAGNPVGDALAYSMKTTGCATLRSINGATGKLEERFIAPTDLVAIMQRKVTAPIIFNQKWVPGERSSDTPVISTMPMPLLMKLLDYHGPMPEFRYSQGFSCKAKLKNTEAYATVYIPDPEQIAYRASITGSELIVEYAFPGDSEKTAKAKMALVADYPFEVKKHLAVILDLFGMKPASIALPPVFKSQTYAKILPIDEEVRRRFILWASEVHRVYSLGRFATWRSNLLLDDLVTDVRIIQKIAATGSYDHRK